MANTSDNNGQDFGTIETGQPLRKPDGVPSAFCLGMDLPSYEEAMNLSFTPPPSYESLYGRLKEAKKSSKGVLDFIKNMVVILVGTIGFSVVLVGTVVIPVGMIVMGSLYMHQCPQGENIPLYLLVGGLLGVFRELLYLSARVRKAADPPDVSSIRYRAGNILLFWFMVGWFVLGSIWVYELYEPNYDPSQGPYCNKTLYLFAYWLITSVYIFLALITFCVCSLAVTMFWMCPERPRCEYHLSKLRLIVVKFLTNGFSRRDFEDANCGLSEILHLTFFDGVKRETRRSHKNEPSRTV